ncbi:MAG: 5'/3'-nucleotidase SurE [Oscillochloris sp.]|nr:5'/3'-nucleotidase SurE [Oscillochloris sp.]
MHILVTNDDGIESVGLWALAGALHEAGLGTVTIVAPLEEQSGMSMSLPPGPDHLLRAVEAPDPAHREITAFAYTGSPVGCVSVAMRSGVMPQPDVVISGINRGLNTGTNVMLSGTVGAAMIGALWGLPAMAVSQQFQGDAPMPWATAAWAAVRLFPLLEQVHERGPAVLNINVPHLHRVEEIRGIRQTQLSPFFYGHVIDMRADSADAEGFQRLHLRFVRERIPQFDEYSDDGAVRAGYVSVTPLAPMMGTLDLDLRKHF